MQHLENIVSHEEISILKEYWNTHNELAYVNGRPDGWHPMAKLADHVDKRLLIANNTSAYQIVKRISEDLFYPGVPIWANYQRQALPHTLHVDEYGRDRQEPTWTIIIALDTEPRNRTVLFKNMFNTCSELDAYVRDCATQRKKISDISTIEDLEHIFDKQYDVNFGDYLEFEGCFSYNAGAGVLFDTNQAHCTSNWKKYPDIQYRDLVQIHIGTAAPNSYNEEEHTKKGDPIPDTINIAE
jgi:hypothetical protein